MRKWILFTIIIIVTLLSAFGIFYLDHSHQSLSYELYTIDKTARLPYYDVDSIEVDHQEVSMTYKVYENLNNLLSEIDTTDTHKAFAVDLLTYLEYYESFKAYRIIAMQPKQVKLVVGPSQNDVEKLNDVEGTIFGITSQASDEYLLRSVIDDEGIVALALDEVLLPNASEKTQMLLDGYVHYTLLESPYADYSIDAGSTSLYTFHGTYDVLLVLDESDNDTLDAFVNYIDSVNTSIDHYNSLTNNQILTKMSARFSPFVSKNDAPTFYKLVPPNETTVNHFVTYLYATRWIDDKYKYDRLALNIFK